jgi:hypothetical protein
MRTSLEKTPDHEGLQGVTPDHEGLQFDPAHSDKEAIISAGATVSKKRICGLGRNVFLAVVALLLLLIIVAAVGGGVGGAMAAKKHTKSSARYEDHFLFCKMKITHIHVQSIVFSCGHLRNHISNFIWNTCTTHRDSSLEDYDRDRDRNHQFFLVIQCSICNCNDRNGCLQLPFGQWNNILSFHH